jgi:hypothetical protein
MRENEWEDIRKIQEDVRYLLREQDKMRSILFEQGTLLEQVIEQVSPRLTSIVISFAQPQGDSMSAPTGFTEGPVTLVTAGQTVQAIVDGYDQFGNSMPAGFVMPTATWTVDNPSFATSTPNADGSTTVAAVADGVANLSVTLTSAEGLALTDTEAITVAIPVTPPPVSVLSSVKVAFANAPVSARR